MKKIYTLSVLAILTFGISVFSVAQISKGGTPSSFNNPTAPSVFDVKNVQAIDVNAAMQEDALRGGPFWAGRSIYISYDMTNSGTWTDLPDGNKIWRLKLTSTGAKGLAVVYDNFFIPEGGKLFLYNEAKTQILGAYTSDNNTTTGIFSTELVQGQSVTLEYIAPFQPKTKPLNQVNGNINGNKITNPLDNLVNNKKPVISISELVYLYYDTPVLAKYDPAKTTGFGSSLPCEVNINCSEGNNWQNEKRGVAEIWLKAGGSWGWCTGSLINTTNNSGIPYFLTADHCHSEGGITASAAEMLVWQFYFKYEAAGCPDPGTEPAYSTLTGCALKAASPINGGSDFCLVLLQSSPPQSYSPFYNGWDRTNTAATSGVGIHHPAGDIKKISTFTSTLGSGTWNDGTNIGAAGAHWTGSYVTTANGYGQTEGGSSGSPIFNQNKRVTGTLTGGSAANCSTGSSFDYGKMWYHWDKTAGGTTTQLISWLDPVSAGSTTINGYDPFAGYPDFYGTPTSIYAGSSVNFTDITNSATSWAWQFEGGSPSTSTAQNPTNIVYNQQGTYRVSLTTTTVIAGTQTNEKTGYITVLPGQPLTPIWCDDFTTPANWTLINHSGVAGQVWAITTAAPTGSYSATNPGKLTSTSGGNYALFDSDGITSTNVEQWASVSSNIGVNCSNFEAVVLKFQEAYTKFYDSTLVYVSTDDFATSTRYVVNAGYSNNQGSLNPENVSLDISAAAAGNANVKVRFTFRSTPSNMGAGAGWGYAWGIDDVCMEGVLPGFSLPNPDFTATTTRKISPGQSVSFQDQSTNATSWLWTFDGGTPSTSTAQNPTGIIYNTQGYYAVTLQATNSNGYVSATKPDYIHVFNDCSYDSNVEDYDDLSYFRVNSPSWGFTSGHNNAGITRFADKFTIGNLTGKVKSLLVAVGAADVIGGTTNVTFTIWDDNAGVPGTVLSTRVMAVKDLLPGYINTVEFSPTTVGSTFWAGFQLTNVANLDTFICYLAYGSPNRTNTAYTFNGTSWTGYEAQYGTNASFYIMPEFCLTKPSTNTPDVDFYADKTEIAPAAAVNFFDQSTGPLASPTSWSWTLTGGTPNSSTAQNPSGVSYASSGLYDVTHTSTNTNGAGNKTKVGYIHVAPTTNIVYWNFPSSPDNATADGGIAANLSATITNWGAPTTQTYATAGATTRSASTTKWNDANAAATYAWSATFTTTGYTNIKLSSKQASTGTGSPRDFAIYYSVNGGDFNYLTSVNPMTTASNWTQGVVSNIQMPSDCDNQASIEVVWYKTSDISSNGGAVTATATSLIDDILITGQACTNLPAAAGTITGPATVCQGSSGNVYTVPSISGATYYNWTVPAGATITAGNYTNTITVTFAQNQQASNITVYGENMCGIGATSPNKAVSFTPVPAMPGSVSGSQTVTNGQTGLVYSVAAVSGATSYTWSVPGFATITSGSTTNSATVSIACPGTYGNFSIHANNACGAGPESYSYSVGVVCNPPTADFSADNTSVLAGATVNFTDLSINSPTSWSWSFSGGTPSTSTVKNPSIVYSSPGVHDVTLTSTNALGSDAETKTGYIIVSAAPVTLVRWDFPNNPDNATADGGVTANLSKTISTQGGAGTPAFGTAGALTRCAGADAWNGGSGSKFWQVDLKTTGYQDIKVSSKMTGNNNASPRDFKLQYRLGLGGTWTNITGATMTLSINNWNDAAANLSAVVLPSACNNHDSLYLRWIMTSNFSLNAGGITSNRFCYIDDIIIIGTPLPPPTANFTGTPTTLCAGQSVTFTDASTNSPSSWSWSFPGGTPATSTAQNPTVTYNTAGTYSVSLTATNAGGSNLKTLTNYITVSAAPSTPTITAGGPTTFCTGGSVTLTSSAGTSYLWSTGATTSSISITTSGSYTVQVTNAGGCQSASSVPSVVTVNALPATPTITAGGSTAFCTGGSVTLTSSAGTTYLWSTGATTSSINVTAAGSYTVQVTNASGCQSAVSAATVVTVNTIPATPTITAGGPITFCAGGSVTLTSSAGTSYLWSTGATTSSISPTTSGSYTVQVTNASGCQSASSAATVVTVNALPATPTITAGDPTTFCTGGSVTLTSSAGISYLWSTGATTSGINVSTSGSYTVRVTNASGCQSANSVATVVTVNALPATPTITAGGSTTFCTGGSVTLTSSAGTNYLWSTGATTSSINAATGGSYTVQVTNASGCQSASSAATVVTVNSLPSTPTITAGGSTTFCTGGSVTLNSSGGTSYLWSTGATTSSISATTSGSYTVQVTNGSGCQSAASTSTVVTVNALPATPTITAGGPTTFCTGGSVTLTSSAGTSYLWSTGETTSGISPTTAGSYTVQVTNASGCQSASSVATAVTVNSLPAAPAITAGGSTTFCSGGSVTLTSSAGTSYLWSTGATTSSISVTTAGSYTVQVTNASGCQSALSSATAVTVNALPATPTITAGGPLTFCTGSNVTLTSSAGTSYLWSTGATTSDINVTASGSYTVQITNASGCQSAASSATVVTVNALPATPTITAGGPTTFCTGSSVTLTSSAGTGYLWSTGATTSGINVTTAGSYSVQVTNAGGCQSASSVATVVTVNSLPPAPTITAGGSTTFCTGGSVALTSSAGTSYLWSTGATTASISATIAGSYTVQVTNASGCQSSPSLATVVTVNALPATPTISAGGPLTFCAGGSVTLTSSAGTSYFWSTGATTSGISPTTSGSYTVQVTNASGCQSAASTASVVTVNTLPATPTITAGGPTTFCAGGSVTLTSSAGTSYLWSTGATTSSISVSTGGSYSVQVTNAGGCQSASSSASVVTVNAIPATPTISASGPTTLCSGENVILTSSAGTSYLWSEGSTTSSINVTTAGSYTVGVTNAAGCQSSNSLATAVVVNPLPVVDAGTDATIPNGTNTTLNATVTGTGPFTYSWSPLGLLVDPSIEDPSTVNLSSTTIFTLTATSTATNCSNSAAVTILISGGALSSTPSATPNTICAGSNVQLDALAGGGSGSYTYTWTSAPAGFTSSIANPIANPSVNTTYSVAVYDGFTTVNSNVAVTVNSLPATPTISAGGSTTFCSGGSVTLTSSTGTSYLWSTGATTPSINVTTGGSYTVQVTNASGCLSAASTPAVVTVNSLPATPTITAGGPTVFCSGDSVTLTSGSGTSYLWSTGATTPSINTTTAGNYSVQITNASGCQSASSSSIAVSVNSLPATPTITAGGPTTFCSNDSVILTSSSAAGYLWSNGASTASIIVNTSGNYTVQVIDANGCQSDSSAATPVTVNASPVAPTITAGGPTSFCMGNSVTLTSSAGTSYLWSGGETTSSINVTTSGNYTVQVTNAGGCQSAASAATLVSIFSIPATPTITASGPTVFCNGDSVTLTSSAETSYLWSNGAVTSSITVASAGSYSVQVSNAGGCQSASSVATVVTVNSLPLTPTITAGGPTTFCDGGSVLLSSSSGTSYLWSSGETTPSISATTAGSYSVQVANVSGCMSASSTTTVVTVDAVPSTPTISAGGPVVFCSGGSVILTSSSGTSYLWSNGLTTASITVSSSGSYSVQVTNASGCQSPSSIATVVTVSPTPSTPTITAGGPTTFCSGDSVILTSSAGTGYLWSDGATSPSNTVTLGGSYSVQVSNSGGCQSASSVATVVTVNALPATPAITAGGPTSFCSGNSVTLTSGSGTSYFWSDGSTTASINVTTGGNYSVQVTNASGCQSASSAATTVTVNASPATPTITASGPTTICTGGSVTLTSSAGTNYLWSTGATTSGIIVSNAGSYSVQVTNPGGCISAASSSTDVIVNVLPTVYAGLDATIPSGTSTLIDATVTGPGPFTFSWVPSGQLVNAFIEDPTTVNLTATTIFTLTATSTTSSCSNSDAVTISISGGVLTSTPTATSGTVCAGSNVQLDALAGGGSGSYTYTWTSIPAGFTSSLANPVANPTVNTTYNVAVFDGSTTVNSGVVVTVNALPPTPTITADGSTNFCSGDSVTLTSSAGTSYLWSDGSTTASISVTTGGNYSVQITNASGCQSASSSAITVTVNSLPATPTITASGPTTICSGGSVTLTSSAGTNYLWSTGATTSGIIVSNAGSYSVQVTNPGGCISAASSSTDVIVNVLPTVYAGLDATIPSGTSTLIDATVTGTGSFTFSWIPSGQLVNAFVEDPTTVNLTATTIFTLTATSTTSSCANSDAVTISISGGPLTSSPTATPGIVCAGSNVQLDALAGGGSGSYTYTWTSIPAGFTSSLANPVANPIVNTTYNVAVFDGSTTVNSGVVVTVNALPPTPTITAGGSTNFCSGESVTLTSSAGTSYFWSDGSTSASINVTTGGNYSVQVTNASGCQSASSAATTITVNSLPATPAITASGSMAICTGSSVTLTSSAEASYLWSTGETTASIDVSIAGSYSVQVTNASGCQSSASASAVVTENSLPATPFITAGGPTTFCDGDNVTLTSSSGTGYLWSDGGTSASIIVTIGGSYSVQVTNSNGCQSASSVATDVTVNALPATPTITAGGPTDFCTGGSVTLTSSAGTNYLWSEGSTTSSINVTTAGNYTVQVTDANGCESAQSDTTTTTENPIPATPVITTGGPTVFCSGDSVILTSSSEASYLWSDGSATSSIMVIDAGSYSVQVISSVGCQSAASSSVDVTVNTSPVTPTITAGGPTAFCDGGSVTLSSSPEAGYTWSDGSISASINANATGSYTVQVTDTNGCMSAASVATDVTVIAAPVTPIISAGGSTGFCDGGDVTLTSSPETSYLWSSGETTASITVNTSGSFTVQVTDANGCQSAISNPVSTTLFAVPSDPIISAGGPIAFCPGGSVTLTSSSGASYLWSDGSTSASISTGDGGNYTVQITDTNGCPSGISAVTTVTINPLPVANAGADQAVCVGQSATLTASGGIMYLWSTASTSPSITIWPSSDLTFYVTVTGANSCNAVDSVSVTMQQNPVAGFTVVDNGFGSISFFDASQNTNSWDWDFGDGVGTSTMGSPNYSYSADGVYTVTQVVSNSCGSDTFTQVITIILSDVRVLLPYSQIEVYPNPNNGRFNLRYSSDSNRNFTMNIFNIAGEIVFSKEYSTYSSTTDIRVDVTKLARGIYQILVNNNDELMKIRLVLE